MSTILDTVVYDGTSRQVAQTNLNITASLYGTSSWAISASFLSGQVQTAPSYANSLLFMGG